MLSDRLDHLTGVECWIPKKYPFITVENPTNIAAGKTIRSTLKYKISERLIKKITPNKEKTLVSNRADATILPSFIGFFLWVSATSFDIDIGIPAVITVIAVLKKAIVC
jgi:hypothetical protein